MSESIKKLIEFKVEETFRKAEEIYGREFKRCPIYFDLKGRCAGQYWSGGKFRFNLQLAELHSEEFVSRTPAHEVAHCIVHQMYGRFNRYGEKIMSHGKEWKAVMVALGQEPSRCHSMDVSKVSRKQERFEYVCKCKVHKITKVRHNKIVQGKRNYVCVTCKERLKRREDGVVPEYSF